MDDLLDPGNVGTPVAPPARPDPSVGPALDPGPRTPVEPLTVGEVAGPLTPRPQGSGGAIFDTSIALRRYLEAQGYSQEGASPGTIRIGDLVAPPSRFGLPDKTTEQLFDPQAAFDAIIPTAPGGATRFRAESEQLRTTRMPAEIEAERARVEREVAARGGGRAIAGARDVERIQSSAGTALGLIGKAAESVDRPFISLVSKSLIASIGKSAELEALARARLAARGVADPSYFDLGDAEADIAGEIFAQAAEREPGAGFAVHAANPVWWAAAPTAGVAVGRSLMTAGVSARTAGFVESLIVNGGLPYADRALNAVFVNGVTRAVARRAGETVGDLTSAIREVLPDVQRFATEEAGTLDLQRIFEVLNLRRSEVRDPRTAVRDLERLADANEKTLAQNAGVETWKVRGDPRVAQPRALTQQFRQTLTDIQALDASPKLEWGQLPIDEQLRQLAIRDPEWEPVLRGYRAFVAEGDDVGARNLIESAREWWPRHLAEQRIIPFDESDPRFFLPGDNGSDVLSARAVAEARARDQYEKILEYGRQNPPVTTVAQTYTVRQRFKGGRALKSFEVLDPQGRVVTRERTESAARRAAADRSLAAASEQQVIPGTPEPEAPPLALRPQEVGEQAAREARGPAGEQTTLDSAGAGPEQQRAIAAARGLDPEVGVQGVQRYQVLATGPDVRLVDLERNEVLRTGTRAELEAIRADAQRLNAGGISLRPLVERAQGRAPTEAPPAAATGDRFFVDPERNAIIDSKTGEIDEKLTSDAFQKPPSSRESGQRTLAGWARWANKKVRAGTWREHAPEIPEGQKLVPESAQVVGEGERVVGAGEPPTPPPPGRPPSRPELPGTPPPAGEPSTYITRVVDRPDGTFSLGRVDVGGELIITGERFTSRESALLSAEARNAENDALTMVGDALHTLRDTLEGIPSPPMLMSPGQAAATRKALEAERAAALKADLLRKKRYVVEGFERGEREAAEFARRTMNAARYRAGLLESGRRLEEVPQIRHLALPGPSGRPLTRTIEQQADIDRAYVAVARARERLRKKLERDPGYGLRVGAGTPPVNRLPTGKTPVPIENTSVPSVAVAARDSLGVLEQLAEVRSDLRAKGFKAGLRSAAAGSIPVASGISRLLLTGFDAGSIGRQMAILGLRSVLSNERRSTFAESAKMVFEGYLRPEAVQLRSLEARAKALSLGSTMHRRTAGEFGGEQIGERVAQVAESVPIIGEGIRRSQVSFNEALNYFGDMTYVNLVRANERAVARGQRNLLAAGPFKGIGPKVRLMTDTEKKQLSETLDHQLGFADIGAWSKDRPKAVQALVELSRFLYAPNWQASRVAVYGDFARALPKVLTLQANVAEKEAFWNGLLFAAGNVGLLMGLASKLGVEIDPDPRSTNFLRLPIGEPSLATSALATPLSALGVGVQTYNETVYLDFTAGLGADFRLIAQLLPFGGDGEGIFTGRAVSASGRESDPWNPQGPFDRDVLEIVVDWLTSRGGPGTQVTRAIAAPRGEQRDLPVHERMMEAIVRSYFPMLVQDAAETSGAFENLDIEQQIEQLQNGGWWAPTEQRAPIIAPPRPAPTSGGRARPWLSAP